MSCSVEVSLLPVVLLLLSHELHCTEEIVGRKGRDINLTFSFQRLSTADITTVSLYKNSRKIEECHHVGTHRKKARLLLEIASEKVILSITNLTFNDSGSYHVTVFLQNLTMPFVESKTVSLIVHLDTESPPSGNNQGSFPKACALGSSLSLFIITALGLSAMLLPTALVIWFHLIRKRGSDTAQLLEKHDFSAGVPGLGRSLRSSAAPEPQQQMSGLLSYSMSDMSMVVNEESMPVPVNSVEYGVLDFQSRPWPGEEDRLKELEEKPQDSVEYAIVTFPLGKKKALTQGQLCWGKGQRP